MLYEEFLVKPYDFIVPAYKGIRQYSFLDHSDTEYKVQFVQKNNNFTSFLMDLSVSFDDNDEYETVNSRDVFKKMSTVIHILNHFIESNTYCTTIEFTPVNEVGKKINRREHLFERYIRSFTAKIHWKYQILNQKFILTKK